ncbi:LolA family protein [Mucisphaera calidilacus]|uniref:Outer membrane lipoprotein carrier protein LolA n=1 Tax=Mucisphaera calidilacus TaxID=2527982 RepID=A0A518BY52_9BACT|nr:outer membrane lipoprotein carrier protein LolA [Mucisphaera calidilacus]QDU71905.1 hypothetical protein Pan265_17640 [Mucisphaera calidilacus]
MRTLIALIVTLLLAVSSHAQDQTDLSPEAATLLQRVEQAADNLKSLRARLRYDRIQGLLGDEQRRFGELRYAAGPPGRFAVHFEYLIVEDRRDRQNRWYIFDGRYLAEKLEDEKLFIRREVVAEDQDAAEADPLRFGSGPFSLPLNLRKDEVDARFVVAAIPPDPDDPENTFHLQLTPRPHMDIEQTQIDLWYDNKTALPRRVRTLDNSENESIIDLLRVTTNEKVREADFSTDPPARGYRVEEHHLESKPQ